MLCSPKGTDALTGHECLSGQAHRTAKQQEALFTSPEPPSVSGPQRNGQEETPSSSHQRLLRNTEGTAEQNGGNLFTYRVSQAVTEQAAQTVRNN